MTTDDNKADHLPDDEVPNETAATNAPTLAGERMAAGFAMIRQKRPPFLLKKKEEKQADGSMNDYDSPSVKKALEKKLKTGGPVDRYYLEAPAFETFGHKKLEVKRERVFFPGVER